MLAILSIWFYVFLICLIYGGAAARLLLHLLGEANPDPGRLPLSLLTILGLSLVTTLAGYLSLFIKIALLANALVFLGALLLAGIYYEELTHCLQAGLRRLFALHKYILALFFLIFLFILVRSAAPPSAFDTGLYHAQAIRWIEEYPVIPGLGNLHGRLAFNSMWLPANALFGFSFLKVQPCHVLNGFFLLVFLFICLQGLSNLINRQYHFSNILRAGMALPGLLVFKDQLSSPTPDVPVALLICLLFVYYVQLRENHGEVPGQFFSLLICFLAAWAITIKLSALPLALLIVAIAGKEIARCHTRNLCLLAGGAAFLVLPYFLRNIWLSGYLLYPFPALDLFHFDWQVPPAAALAEKRAVEAFARDPGYVLTPAALNSAFAWAPTWFQQTLADYGSKLARILLPGLVLLVDCLVNAITRKTWEIDLGEIGKNAVLYLTAAGGLLFWFFTAPDPRFAMGYLLVAVIIIFIPLLKAFDYQVTRIFPWSLALLMLYFVAAFLPPDLPTLGQRLWLPAPYPQERLTVEEIQGRQVYFPGNPGGKCWYAPLPCTYHPVNFVFRGAGMKDGFQARSAP
jgi:hypothetical protein